MQCKVSHDPAFRFSIDALDVDPATSAVTLIRGWIFDAQSMATVKALRIRSGEQMVTLTDGIARPDVEAALDLPTSAVGFEGRDFSAALPMPISLDTFCVRSDYVGWKETVMIERVQAAADRDPSEAGPSVSWGRIEPIPEGEAESEPESA